MVQPFEIGITIDFRSHGAYPDTGVALPFGWIISPSAPIPTVWNENIGFGYSHILPQKVRISRSHRGLSAGPGDLVSSRRVP